MRVDALCTQALRQGLSEPTAEPPHEATPSRAPAAPARAAPKTETALHRTALEMEAVFVRHLLEAAKMGGDAKGGGYASMAVDALAAGIEKGGGIGLARRLEEALAPPHPRVTGPGTKHG